MNPFPSNPLSDFLFVGEGHRFGRLDSAGLLAKLFPPSQLVEFIPLGMATSFNEGSKVTLEMLRRFANMPHVLCFGRLHFSDSPTGGQKIEFIPVGVATSFGQGGKVTLEMLRRLAHVPHMVCFGRLGPEPTHQVP